MAVIKEDARKRTDKLAKLMGWDRRTAAGAMEWVWEDSQIDGIVCATADELCDWADVKEPAERKRFIEALQARTVCFVTKMDDGTYLIHGNAQAIKNRDGGRKQRREAALERWRQERERQERERQERARKDAESGSHTEPVRPAENQPENEVIQEYEPHAARMRAVCETDAGKGKGKGKGSERTPVVPASPGTARKRNPSPRSQADDAFAELTRFGTRDRSPSGFDALSPIARAVVRWRYTDAAGFCSRYERAFRAGREGLFEKDLKADCRAFVKLPDAAARIAAPPEPHRIEIEPSDDGPGLDAFHEETNHEGSQI